MKRPAFLLSAGLGALLLAGLCWWWSPGAVDAEKAVAASTPGLTAALRNSPGTDALQGADEPEWRTGGAEASDPRVAKLFEGLRGQGRRGTISRQALEAFLAARERSSGSLLAAWEESRDIAYLREAAERFPNDPSVQLAAAMSPSLGAERAVWIERLKKSDPENPLPNWIAAADHFSGKRGKEAIAELLAADGKTSLQNYAEQMTAERRDLFESAGMEPMRAQIEALLSTQYGYLGQLQSAVRGIDNEVKGLRAGGDPQTAQDLSATAVNMGRILSANPRASMIDQLVGISIESAALKQIPAAEAIATLGMTTAQRAAELEQKKRELLELGKKSSDLIRGRVTMDEITEYFQRRQREGEMAALRWLADRRTAR